MTKDEYIATFLEGAELIEDHSSVVKQLLGVVYTLRSEIKQSAEHIFEIKERHSADISEMNDIARDSGWYVKCRGCDKDFQPDCELSEIIGAERYCGGSQWCTP